jgi:hypothetical protein
VYIDKNFAGVLVVWDRLFGTFEPEHEDIPCEYGITDDFESVNPWTITFYEWRRIFADFMQGAGLKTKLQALFGAPKPKLAEGHSALALQGEPQQSRGGAHD